MFHTTANRFTNNPYAAARSFSAVSRPFTGSMHIVPGGVLMDPFYRSAQEKNGRGGRQQHLGVDITGSGRGDGSITDVRRGQPVYAAVKTELDLAELNTVRAFNKRTNAELTGLGLPATGTAVLSEAKLWVQPWRGQQDHDYGGIVGMSCMYGYGSGQEFTLYIEFLHLITEDYLPKDAHGRVASRSEWTDTGRGIGFGPGIRNAEVVPPSFFQGPVYALVGYLGATQTPHVHVQVAFFPNRTFDKNAVIRVDPMAIVY
ncbi:MAG TPA: hypothetical protein VHK69_15815 [Chitinophagaceae bacterium]|nr:hypothetical protein [Chitinophagaceae bacterium]